ncbi:MULTISPECIES: hypothetical protein [unclassified Halomonas]|uniref:hypothetical protein n=1 Tax=unclassified Halomonas TaxID=2609666 RepID=UPI0007D97603|nr:MULTISPECIES: hypothetical protein [unclassified Halomonas]MBT2788081.1 hypothetical protein [Halomonas sp. ISL-106]MBT2795830.1 hypothetical protein [Halomonas sp. ISL-104]OAL61113.1 hypothetical protein A6R74_16075 [Halomonas sp. ALS9]
MSCQATKAVWAAFMILAVTVLGQLSQSEAEEQSDWLVSYCTDVAIWAAEEARGVPLEQRTGQPDYKGIAEESCPGMRPAAPSLNTGGNSPAQLAMPDTVPFQQLVQF